MRAAFAQEEGTVMALLRRRVALSAGLAVLLLGTGRANGQDAVEKLIGNYVETIGPQHRDVQAAIVSFQAGNFVEARQLLERARQEDPQLAPVGVMLARLLFAANQAGLARAELEKVVMAEPADPEPYLVFGELALNDGRPSDAQLAYGRALQMTEGFAGNDTRRQYMLNAAHSGLAAVAERREDWRQAQKHLEALVEADPGGNAATVRLARARFEQGDEKGAYGLLQELWKRDSSVRRPEITMALLYEGAGKRANAQKLMELASQRDQENAQSQRDVARWALEAGELETARQSADRAVQLEPNSLDARILQGLVARYANDLDAARQAFQSVHLASPTNLAALLQLAILHQEQTGAERTALEYAQLATRVYTDLAQQSGREAAVTLAWILYRQGRASEAQRALQQALVGSVGAESAYYAARILQEAGNGEAARKLLESALRNDSVFPARADAEALLKQLGG
jgi:tetratricopeptide (TPR) repeat protein